MALEARASFRHTAVGPFLGPDFARNNVILSLRVVKITLVTREGDGYLQFAPLLSKAETFSLEARILASKLCPDLAHRIRRPLKELLTKGVMLPSVPEYVFRVTLCL